MVLPTEFVGTVGIMTNTHKGYRASDRCEIVGTACSQYANAHKEHRPSDCEFVGTVCVCKCTQNLPCFSVTVNLLEQCVYASAHKTYHAFQ